MNHSRPPMKAWLAATLLAIAMPLPAQTTPTEFVTQVLEPTGGRIERPRDWHYEEGHRGSVYVWTLSKEDASGGKPYTTGVRIQTFVGVEKNTGKSARQFVLDFADGRRKGARVVSSCEPQEQGLFMRACLETEEGPYRIQYSLFWGRNGLDLAVISIAGTRRELWEAYAPTFTRMAAFEIIDMKRFGNK